MKLNKGIFVLLSSIFAIIFLSVFSSCNSSSNHDKEIKIMECITRENTKYFNSDNQYSITYVGNNWFKVSSKKNDITENYSYYKIKKDGNKFIIEDKTTIYSECMSNIADLPVGNRIKLWFKTIKYDYVQSYFQGNLCLVKNDNKCGFINFEGDEILPSKYNDIEFVTGNLYKDKHISDIKVYGTLDSLLNVKLDDKYGFLTYDGKEIIPCKYDTLVFFTYKGDLIKAKLDNKYGLFTYDGKEILPCKYDDLEVFGSDLLRVRLDNKYGLYTYDGKEIIPCKYDYLTGLKDGLLIVILDNKYGLITYDEKKIIPCKYDYLENFTCGSLRVRLNNKYGLITYDGKEIIPCKFDGLTRSTSFQNCYNLIYSISNNKYGLIEFQTDYNSDKSNWEIIKIKELLPCTFDNIETPEKEYTYEGEKFVNEMVRVQRNNLWSYYKIDGTQVTRFYDDVKYFDTKKPTFAAKSNGKWGYLDKNGEEITSFRLDEAEEPNERGIASVTYEGRYGYIDIKTGTIYIKNGYDNDYNSDSNNSMSRTPCRVCNGTGQMPIRGGGIVLGTQNCQGCGGSGYHLSW